MVKRVLAALACLTAFVVLTWSDALHSQGTVIPAPVFTAFDNNGAIISGGKLCTYAANSTTPQATYSNSALTVANTNPVVMDSSGRATIFLSPVSYKFVLLTAGTDSTCNTGTTLWTVDNVNAVPSTAGNLDVLGTAGETLNATQVVYLSDGSGGKIAGQWYKADSGSDYSSTTVVIGVVPANVASGAVGTIRVSGIVTGFSSLTVGAVEHVTSAGALNQNPQNFARVVGQAVSATDLLVNPGPPNLVLPELPTGRLTLNSVQPVPSSDVTAATTMYYEPYVGNTVTLYDGVKWFKYRYTAFTATIPATTSTMYDAFIDGSTGSGASLTFVAWTNDTTRATALTTQDGMLVQTGNTSRRYVGSFRTTAVSGQTEDSAAKRYVWNYYNRRPRQGCVTEATANWDYSTAAWRQARATATNQLDLVVGFSEDVIHADLLVSATDTAGAGIETAGVAIGLDSTTTPAGRWSTGTIPTIAGVQGNANFHASYDGYPGIGRHTLVWLEYGDANLIRFLGSGAGVGPAVQSGICGVIPN